MYTDLHITASNQMYNVLTRLEYWFLLNVFIPAKSKDFVLIFVKIKNLTIFV